VTSDQEKHFVSFVIVTRNRREELVSALTSIQAQSHPWKDILVFDDRSTDGTAEVVTERFPNVRYFPAPIKSSPTSLRNLGFRNAFGSIVFNIDDDAYFAGCDVVAVVLQSFAADKKISAVAIPFIEPYRGRIQKVQGVRAGEEISSFVACSVAFRKDAVLQVGGYRESLGYGGEERDLAIRLRDRGYTLIMGHGLVVHTTSPKRDSSTQRHLTIRNTLLFYSFNVPLPEALYRLVVSSLALMKYRFSWSSLFPKLKAICLGWFDSVRYLTERRPVSRQTYVQFRHLPRHGPSRWVGRVPPPCSQTLHGSSPNQLNG
jgi:GT2 family glycosyltransferase